MPGEFIPDGRALRPHPPHLRASACAPRSRTRALAQDGHAAAAHRRECLLGQSAQRRFCPIRCAPFWPRCPSAPPQLELESDRVVLFDDEELFTARVRAVEGHRRAHRHRRLRHPLHRLQRAQAGAARHHEDRPCFIHGIDRSRDMRSLCQTIVAMARQLKLRTVAEGVEERGELEVLREIGCDAAQGYLLQRPVPAEEFTAFLRAWPERMRLWLRRAASAPRQS